MTRILMLDDSRELLKLLGLIFKRAGYECVQTEDGEEALQILHAQPIDLVTQDYMRAGMDGGEWLRRMRSDEKIRHIPVLLLTAGAREGRAEMLRQHGLDIDRDLDGFLNKPVSPQVLLDTVAAILERHSKQA